jgi:hypothetical protein
MIEAMIALAGLIGGFLVALGWYRRGIMEMEKEINSIKERLWVMEKESHNTHTDIEVIKQRIGYMESKIDEIHSVIMHKSTVT